MLSSSELLVIWFKQKQENENAAFVEGMHVAHHTGGKCFKLKSFIISKTQEYALGMTLS